MKRGQDQRKKPKSGAPNNSCNMAVTLPYRLLEACSYLSSTNDEHPQLSEEMDLSGQDKTQLLVAMIRYVRGGIQYMERVLLSYLLFYTSKGWRARYVTVKLSEPKQGARLGRDSM
jgi:hypothetical protein